MAAGRVGGHILLSRGRRRSRAVAGRFSPRSALDAPTGGPASVFVSRATSRRVCCRNGSSGSSKARSWSSKAKSPLAATFGVPRRNETRRRAQHRGSARAEAAHRLGEALDHPGVRRCPPARVCSPRERWSGAPLMAGFRRGAGARALGGRAARHARLRALSLSAAGAGRSRLSSRPSAPRACGRSSIPPTASRVDLGLLRRPLAQGRHRRAARRRLAFLGTRSRRATNTCAA